MIGRAVFLACSVLLVASPSQAQTPATAPVADPAQVGVPATVPTAGTPPLNAPAVEAPMDAPPAQEGESADAPGAAAPVPPIVAAQLSRPPAPSEHELAEPKPPGPGARIELSLLSAPLGAGAGLLFCLASECDEARPVAASMLIGAGAGVALSALVTRKTGLEFATAQAIEGGAIWGTTTSLYLWLLASSQYDPRGLFFGMAAGELVGAGLGGVLERQLRPTSGAVALANSSSLWLSAIGTLMTFSINLDLNSTGGVRGMAGGLLAAEVLGLGLGGLLGQRFEARRSQVWLADVGAVLLGGTGPLLTWLLAGDDVAPEALMGSTAAGMGIGFVTAYLLTEFLPRRAAAAERAATSLGHVRLAMMPLRAGGGLSLSSRLR